MGSQWMFPMTRSMLHDADTPRRELGIDVGRQITERIGERLGADEGARDDVPGRVSKQLGDALALLASPPVRQRLDELETLLAVVLTTPWHVAAIEIAKPLPHVITRFTRSAHRGARISVGRGRRASRIGECRVAETPITVHLPQVSEVGPDQPRDWVLRAPVGTVVRPAEEAPLDVRVGVSCIEEDAS